MFTFVVVVAFLSLPRVCSRVCNEADNAEIPFRMMGSLSLSLSPSLSRWVVKVQALLIPSRKAPLQQKKKTESTFSFRRWWRGENLKKEA